MRAKGGRSPKRRQLRPLIGRRKSAVSQDRMNGGSETSGNGQGKARPAHFGFHELDVILDVAGNPPDAAKEKHPGHAGRQLPTLRPVVARPNEFVQAEKECLVCYSPDPTTVSSSQLGLVGSAPQPGTRPNLRLFIAVFDQETASGRADSTLQFVLLHPSYAFSRSSLCFSSGAGVRSSIFSRKMLYGSERRDEYIARLL